MTRQLIALLLSLCAGVVSAAAVSNPSEVRIRVDAGQQSGPVPIAYRAGIFVGSVPSGYPREMFLTDQRPGMLQFSWQVYGPLANAATESEFFARLPQSDFTAWVREAAAAGAEAYILLMPVPRWLRAGGDDAGRHRLPRDLPGWERFVQRVVDYFSNQLRIDARYIVWDEPNLFYQGSTEDYLLLYKHAAAGLLRANPKAKIGGPAVSEFYADQRVEKNRPTFPLLPAFVRYCATTPLPGLAPRLPLDILVWHTFDAAPVSPGQYELEVRAARALLSKHGYPEDTELNIGSWSALDKYPALGAVNVRDSEFLSAFVVASVIAMERAGVNRHAFFNLFEDWMGYKTEFSDGEGLVTRNYVTKPAYHAFRLLSRLEGQRVPVQVSDPYVQAAAASNGRTLRVIAANFAPPAAMLRLRAEKQLGPLGAGYTRDKIAGLLPPGEKVEQLLQDRRRIETMNLPSDVRAAALEVYDGARLSNLRQREPVSLQVSVAGLSGGRYRVSEYRIDRNNANAYSQRGSVDERSLQQAKQSGRAAAREYLATRWSPPEMAQLQTYIDAGDLGRLMDRIRTLPPDKQRDAQTALSIMRESQSRFARDINARLHPRAQNVSEVSITGQAGLQVTVPPYGVVLLEVDRLD